MVLMKSLIFSLYFNFLVPQPILSPRHQDSCAIEQKGRFGAMRWPIKSFPKHIKHNLFLGIWVFITYYLFIHSLFIYLFIYYHYPRPVLVSGYCCCLSLSLPVHLSVCRSLTCLRDYVSPVQARITKFGTEVKTSGLRSLLFWDSLTLTFKFKLNAFINSEYPFQCAK